MNRTVNMWAAPIAFLRNASCALLLSSVCVNDASAVDKSWTSAVGGFWSDGSNWTSAGAPGIGDDVFIGVSPLVEDDTVYVDQNVTIASLELTDGMTIFTEGFPFIVQGDVLVSGRNGPPNFFFVSHFRVMQGANATDAHADNIVAANEGAVSLVEGAVLAIDERLTINADSALRGKGTVNLLGNGGRSLVLDGVLTPRDGGMVINQLGTGLIDLDGDLAGSRILLFQPDDTATGTLTINGTALNDPFGGEVEIVGGGFLQMNLTAGWAVSAGGSILLMGPVDGGLMGTTELRGDDLALQGHLTASDDADARVLAPITIQSGSEVRVIATSLLRFQNAAVVEGGEFELSEGSDLDFFGATTIAGGSFVTHSQNIVDGVIDFSGLTSWQGTVSIDGVARQNGDATVTGTTVINGGVFDLDGFSEAAISWEINSPLTLNVDKIESAAGNRFDGEMTIAGSALNKLVVNLTNPADAWQMDGVLNLSGNNLLFFDRVFGSTMAVTGTVNVQSRVSVTAPTAFGSGAIINFDSAAAQLRLSGTSLIGPGTTINGNGLLINRVGGRMTIADGINLNDAGLLNSGLLVIDEEAGTILVDRFENGSAGTLQIEIGGLLGGDYDSLSTTLGPATLNGQLQVLLINAGLGMFLPSVGDDFTILTAIGGVTGTFANPPAATNVGGILYEWDVDYNPTTVVLELADIGGLRGDYNANGVVDAADYAVWRDSLGENTFLAADGNQNGVVDAGDYAVWIANFGDALGAGAATSVPEPISVVLISLAAVGMLGLLRKTKNKFHFANIVRAQRGKVAQS